MITELEMYWLTRLDGLNNCASWVLILSLFASVFAAVGYVVAVAEDDEDTVKKLRTPLKLVVLTTVASACIILFLPTMKEMAAIKVIPMIANSEQIRKLGDVGSNMLDLANEWLLELKPKKSE